PLTPQSLSAGMRWSSSDNIVPTTPTKSTKCVRGEPPRQWQRNVRRATGDAHMAVNIPSPKGIMVLSRNPVRKPELYPAAPAGFRYPSSSIPSTSGLTYTIKRGNREIDLELKQPTAVPGQALTVGRCSRDVDRCAGTIDRR